MRGLDPRISRSVSPAEMAGTSPAMTVVGGQEGAVPAGAAATRRYSPYTACALPAKIARRSASLSRQGKAWRGSSKSQCG